MFLIRCQLLVGLCTMWSANGGWIDVDTPEDKMTTASFIDGSTYDLVMSDEFNVANRSFADGDDPMWTALDKSDDDSSAAGGGSQHFYNSTACSTTDDGFLRIQSTIEKTEWSHYDLQKKEYRKVTKNFKSGMMQSWNKFCFTGGIVEVDLIFPGDPHIGGLWPAVWMLGNLGRATYEATTNNIWPWSNDECNWDQQEAQKISPCNVQNHFGLHPKQGRGATEIDLLEVMAGIPDVLEHTVPPIRLPYIDMTLQVAPGITKNRPTEGKQPKTTTTIGHDGHTKQTAEQWYPHLGTFGNTSINPFFYGTYLGVTKPEEPVQRNKHQTFQADAVGVMHQVTPAHFNTTQSFRIEWQPGPGGRLDWFTKAHRIDKDSMDESIEGDGEGQEWVKSFSILSESLDITGATIPNEPSYFILNTAISSTWGFPYDVKDWCTKCYDCDDPKCECSFYPGFCNMMKGDVSMYVDSIRLYQSKNDTAHGGNPHTIGCDPVEYPTKEWIKGHEYLYSRQPPFNFDDIGPLKKIIRGGGKCTSAEDCGGTTEPLNQTTTGAAELKQRKLSTDHQADRGMCVSGSKIEGLFSTGSVQGKVCKCLDGFTGPMCLSPDHHDDELGAYELLEQKSIFEHVSNPYYPTVLLSVFLTLCFMLLMTLVVTVIQDKNSRLEEMTAETNKVARPDFRTGRSI